MCDVSPRIREGRETWHIKLAREGEGGAMANTQTYGFPIYAADWIPEETVRSKIDKDKENSEDGIEPSSSLASRSCIALAGGGGEGRSGIPNVIVICRVDLETNSLLEQPVSVNVSLFIVSL